LALADGLYDFDPASGALSFRVAIESPKLRCLLRRASRAAEKKK